ncbi:DNA mismatch repair protein Msh3 [Sodiomyces alkalinus F11]|uniref:DNA mismatch repair protein n=1 Tax=Sodiomyces alkalinus (strain CBS 110278 / VKM F-3762 / F11) TaxID=1314773 RepID=A0A3N2PS35_SODAK|nr:DNA mismatch repair protein Msh3 [Sodiomyces alkalinus F11]ROT37234.1 DNA mismatch repair protein Msh3 [Sodiomyces alkalinus F11]
MHSSRLAFSSLQTQQGYDSNGQKQRSLTSFFSSQPKSKPQSPAASREPRTPSETSLPGSARKRPLEEDADRVNKPAKRSKGRTDEEADVQEANPLSSPASNRRAAAGHSTLPSIPSSSRTERYLYEEPGSSNPLPVEEEEEEEGGTLSKKRKEELHKKFVKKLGHPDSMQLRGGRWNGDGEAVAAGVGEDEDGGEDDDDEPNPPPKPTRKTGGGASAKAGKKLTPMELQFLEIKRKHLDTILIVEVGYKFRFFGEDARIASKELGIVCIPGKYRYDEHPSEAHWDRFASASIPVHRLSVHAKRLVAAGHKVGVVRQIETAALKKAGDNRNAPFIRKLTNVYTKGTYIDETGDLDMNAEGGGPSGGYLLCITETPSKGHGTDEKVQVGIVAVQPATGDIIYDNFEDGFMRSEIETRLLHISPCEFVIVGDLTKGTDKMIQHLAGSSTNVFGDRSRVERVPRSKTMAAEAYSHVTQFYAGKLKGDKAVSHGDADADADADEDKNDRAGLLLDKVLHLPESVTICLSAMINHLTEYGLQHIFDLTKYFQSFTTRQHMLINGSTLESLEVYRNATDHAERGSLFWALDKTTTRFGQRLLRRWVGRPLLDKDRLEDRVDAVDELARGQSTAHVDKLETLLAGIKTDLERSLIRIYYGKCSRPELLAVLQTLQRIASQYVAVKSAKDTGFESRLLTDAILALPRILEPIITFLDKINADAARRDDKYNFFREAEQNDDIQDHKMGIISVEQELDAHRRDATAKLGRSKPVDYTTVAGIEYLVEVPNTDLKRVPASWAKVSGTKKVSRFHTPEVIRLLAERDQHREALAAACDAAFAALLRSLATDAYQPLRDAVASLASLDCLLSLSRVARLPGYTRPTFLPPSAPPQISITAGRHPIADHTLAGGYIPFSASLASPSPLAYLITGPNMGGKSSFVRALALLALLAQIGSFVPAASLTLTLVDGIHARMGARDNLFAGESTFALELSETARILRAATPRSLVLLDELGRGTSTHDGAAIAHAVLHHIVRETRCLTLFITHYQDLARVADGFGNAATSTSSLSENRDDGNRRGGALVKNVHMRFTATKTTSQGSEDEGSEPENIDSRHMGNDGEEAEGDEEASSADEEITFLYEVGEGVAHRSYGLNVARLARIPRKAINLAARKSSEMEWDMKLRRLRGTAHFLSQVVISEDPLSAADQLEHLISSIEQL